VHRNVSPVAAVAVIVVTLAVVWFLYTRVFHGMVEGQIGPPQGVAGPAPPVAAGPPKEKPAGPPGSPEWRKQQARQREAARTPKK